MDIGSLGPLTETEDGLRKLIQILY